MIGDGRNVRTRAFLNFPKPLPFEFEPWNIPTNLISQPLASFMAIGGIRPWLAALPAWKDLQIGSPPNQFYAWALTGPAPMTYFAAPQADASNQVSRITELVLDKVNPLFGKEGVGRFERATNAHGIFWTGFPAISPFLQSTVTSTGDFIVGGAFVPSPAVGPLPLELLGQILPQTNLVCYEWENTGQRVTQWLLIAQTIRLLLHQAQLPQRAPFISWIDAAATKLVTCLSGANQTSPNQLLFVRRSSVGLSSIELQLLADWLESPTFPHGLHTFVASETGLAPQ
jgi:hypothetical protein